MGSTEPSLPVADRDPPVRLPLGLGLRPRRPTAVLDAAFELIRFRFWTLLVVGLLIQLPLVVLPGVMATLEARPRLSGLLDPEGESVAFGGFSVYAAGGVNTWWWIAAVGGSVAIALTGLATTHLFMSWTSGEDPGISDTLGVVARRAPVAIAAWLVGLPIRAIGFLACGVGLIFVVALLLVVSPVVVAEGAGPFRAVKRSFHLTQKRLGPVLGIVCMIAVVAGVIELFVDSITGAVTVAEDASFTVVLIATSVSLAFTLGLTLLHAAWATLTYVDLRVRVEGLDLLLAAPTELGQRSIAVPGPRGPTT